MRDLEDKCLYVRSVSMIDEFWTHSRSDSDISYSEDGNRDDEWEIERAGGEFNIARSCQMSTWLTTHKEIFWEGLTRRSEARS